VNFRALAAARARGAASDAGDVGLERVGLVPVVRAIVMFMQRECSCARVGKLSASWCGVSWMARRVTPTEAVDSSQQMLSIHDGATSTSCPSHQSLVLTIR